MTDPDPPVERFPMLEHARRITSNASRLLVGELGNRALRFIALLVMARYLSVTDFGIVNVAIAVSGILLVVTSLGLPDQGSREVAATPGKAGWLLGRVSTIRVLTLTLVGAAGCVIMLIVSDGGLDIALLIVAMALMMALSADWLSRGLERMGTIAFASLGGGLVMVLGTLALAAAGGDVITTMLLFTCAEAVLTAILWLFVNMRVSPSFGVTGTSSLLRRARPLAFSAIAIYIYYANVDTVLIAIFHGPELAGQYTAAYRLFLFLNLPAFFTAYSMLPTLTRLAEADDAESEHRIVASSLKLLAAYGLAVVGGTELLGHLALKILFGLDYTAAGPTLVLLSSGAMWYVVGFTAGYSLLAVRRNSSFLRGAAVASILNVALNLALIPPLGMTGAGIATLVSFLCASLVWLDARGVLRESRFSIMIPLGFATVLAVCAQEIDEFPIYVATAIVTLGLAATQTAGVVTRIGRHRPVRTS